MESTGMGSAGARKKFLQRCAVRVTYSPNRIRGQWAAHGRYVARESATRESDGRCSGFATTEEGIDVPQRLSIWQNAGDHRLFKLIISPEFGERLDLRRHTRELLARMERDLGAPLEWVAVAHFNTDHPHVHIALRGRTAAGPLRLPRDYIKQGIRGHAENLCTAQLGFRTELDALEAERREIEALHLTSLDRTIARNAFGSAGEGMFDPEALPQPRSQTQLARRQFLTSRLRTLAGLDLAVEVEAGRFQIDPAFLSKLRAMQIGADRQKMRALGIPAVTSTNADDPRMSRARNRDRR